MSFRINTNTNALFNQAYGKFNQNKIDKALEQLSTGRRINRAADDK